ncbi:akl1p [Saccharomyces arboricola H-6]|uniref:Akl1p n=1 Tax=Saccharomyces arboricola (strain H-6 / AS 2.3317 / CBS 10644) TaxID=1160507 RepID=J8Q562_SACAR|nr:akl1p [Saccharomyces arboricola H-6]
MSITNGTSRSVSAMGHPAVERYTPGHIVCVGAHKVEVVNYLAEGGFAQIYVVKFLEYLNEFDNTASVPLKIGDVACLKRVLVHDENGLNEMRNEVEVMKKLKGAANVVQYFDSNASRRRDGVQGFEVLLLMELCPNKSLLDYMNQRLSTKLTESEIVKIMYDVALSISEMHYLPVPLIHRDIKIENVLVDGENNFKLADFGSTSTCFPIVTTHQDIALLTQNIYVHTTPQYRSPEMIDLYRCLPINEKSDIWALGIFLYKLLFFTTPFEMTGQFAILHSKYEFPVNKYSSKLINLIIIMLAENPNLRPNIYQVLYHLCDILNVEVPIEDKYVEGAYNFGKYTQFQNKLQNVQLQMYQLQRKKIMQNNKLSNSEENLLNDMFLSSFEISSKLPMNASDSSAVVSRTTSQNTGKEGEEKKEGTSEQRNPVTSEDKASRGTFSNTDSNTLNFPKEFSTIQSPGIEDKSIFANKTPGELYYPSVSELDTYLDKELVKQPSDTTVSEQSPRLNAQSLPQRQKSTSSYSSGGRSMKSTSYGAATVGSDEVLTNEKTTGTSKMKQHKSNNPFPKINVAYQSTNELGKDANNFFLEEQQQNQRHQQTQNQPGAQGNAYSEEAQYQPRVEQQQHQQPQDQPQTPANYGQRGFYTGRDRANKSMQMGATVAGDSGNRRVNFQNISQNYGANSQSGYFSGQNSSAIPIVRPVISLNNQQAQQMQAQQIQAQQQMQAKQQIQAQKQMQIPSANNNVNYVSDRAKNQITDDMRNSQAGEPAATAGNPINEPMHSSTQNEGLLIELSPLKEDSRKQTFQDKNVSQPGALEEAGVNGNKGLNIHRNSVLNLSLNEMDLSRDDTGAAASSSFSSSSSSSLSIQPAKLAGRKDSNKKNNYSTDELGDSMVSSESIDIDLDNARRGKASERRPLHNERSHKDLSRPNDVNMSNQFKMKDVSSPSKRQPRQPLDLNFQEVNLSSPTLSQEHRNKNDSQASQSHHSHRGPPHSSTTMTENKRHSTGHESTRSSGKHETHRTNSKPRHDLERYRKSKDRDSNSSITISTSTPSEMRKSFARARQSLDLERVRREAMASSGSGSGSSGGKRRSIFSVFRSEK